MDDKRPNEEEELAEDSEDAQPGGTASRARNRTVLLTPEITGQVRSMLGDEGKAPARERDPLADLLPPLGGLTGSARSPRPSEAFRGAPISDGTPLGDEAAEAGRKRSSTGKVKLGGVSSGHSGGGSAQPLAAPPSFSVNPTVKVGASPQSIISRSPRTRIVGFFISFDSDTTGEVFEIRSGRWLLTSRPTDHGDFILIEDDTISPLHAIIRATSSGAVQVLDQLSEHGTGVTAAGTKKEQEVAGSMVSVGHGDIVRFGTRKFVVCIVPEAGAISADSTDKKK